MLTGIQKRLDRFPPGEREARERLLSAMVDVVLEESLENLTKLEQGFEALPAADPEREARDQRAWLLAARARNAARALEDRVRLERESLPAADVMRGLAVSRQRLHQLRAAGRLVAVRSAGSHGSLYPAWQFGEDWTVVPDLPAIVSAAKKTDLGSEVLHFFMTEPHERLGGEAPIDLVNRGETARVLTVLRSSSDLGSF